MTMPYQAGSSAQRIRIGLTGLAFAFLLVLLGSIISRSSRDDVTNAAHRRRNEPSEPLAELGVAPGASDRPTTIAPPRRNDRARRARARLLLVSHHAVAALAFAAARRSAVTLPPRARGERPALLLLTSLPLVFSEDFSLQEGGSPALDDTARPAIA